jgi:TPR repeat protein
MERDMRFGRFSTYILSGLMVLGAAQPAAAQSGTAPAGYTETLRWYHARAEAGDPRAQFLLGVKYETGTDVSRDLAKARELYIRAARQGHADAQFRAGTLAQDAAASDEDLKVARDWYQAAAIQGHVPAQYNLAVLLANAAHEEDGFIEAASWSIRAAAGGLPQAEALRATFEMQLSADAYGEAARLSELPLQP